MLYGNTAIDICKGVALLDPSTSLLLPALKPQALCTIRRGAGRPEQFTQSDVLKVLY
jgi:hypothetical protein